MATANLRSKKTRRKLVGSSGADMGRPPKQPDKSTFRGRLAALIRARREALGLTVADIEARLQAAGTPISSHALYKYETGERPVTADDLPALAKALETSIHKLIPAK